jgi:putative addiction module component (TIGR02574 family)
MSTQLEIVEAQALSLAAEERAQLADRLIASLFDDQDIEEAWAVEVERRIKDIESGRAKLIPASEAIARARRDQVTPSVSPEADRELTEGGVFYAREGGRELGLAFIAEFEELSTSFVSIRALVCLGETIGAASRCDGFPTASSTTSETMSFVWSLSPIIGRGRTTGWIEGRPVRRCKD